MTSYAHIAQRLFNRPLAIHPRKAEMVIAALAERMGVASLVRMNGDVIRPAQLADMPWDDDDDGFGRRRETVRDPGYDMVGDTGVALIEISGTLVHKLGSLRPYSGMTGYDGIRVAYLNALRDDQVRAVVLNIDSPGGEVAGCFDLVDAMAAADRDKPVWAILDECAFSAAYAAATVADRIIVPRTGGTGSIGVIAMHVDLSDMLSEAGVKVTFITSDGADRKADGHPEIPLSPEAYDAFKAEVDAAGQIFYETVARGRRLTAEAVKGLKAACFQGADGLPVGLADEVLSPADALQALLADL